MPVITNYAGRSYGLLDLPTDVAQRTEENSGDTTVLKWSGKHPIPAIGERVHLNFNEFGNGTVVSYFWEHGYLGVYVKLVKAPAWHNKQMAGNPRKGHCMAFGVEVGPIVRKSRKAMAK